MSSQSRWRTGPIVQNAVLVLLRKTIAIFKEATFIEKQRDHKRHFRMKK